MKKPKAEVRPIVLVVNQDGETREYEFKQDSIILGSGPTANVIIDHESVSSIHAIIKATIEAATLIDLGSDAGTRVNGVEQREVKLKDGDRLTLGHVGVLVQLPATVSEDAEPPTTLDRVAPRIDDPTKPAGRADVASQSEFSVREEEVTGTDTVVMPFGGPMASERTPSVVTAEQATRAERALPPAAQPRVEAKKPEAKAAEPKPAQPKQAEPKQAEPKQAEPKQAEAKQAEPKKAKPVAPLGKGKAAAAAPIRRPAPPASAPRPERRADAEPRDARDDRLPDLDGRLAGVKLGASGIPADVLEQPIPRSERAHQGEQTLQVALFWGNELYMARHLADGEVATIGEAAGNTFRVPLDGIPASMVCVYADGTVVVPRESAVEAKVGKDRLGREKLEIRGRLKAIDAPFDAAGFRLGLDERVAVAFGDLTLVAHYVLPAPPIVTTWTERIDQTLLSTAIFVALFALFTFMMVVVAPRDDRESADDLFKHSPRFARLMLKEEQKKQNKAFELAGKKGGGKTKEEEGKWGKREQKVRDAQASAKGAPRVDPTQRERDRKVALSSGLLRALGGKQNAVANVFGPGGLGTGINSALGGLKGQASGDTGGLAGLGSRGTGPGADGKSVGIGNIGNAGSVGTGGLGNVDLGGRGRSERSVEAGKTVVSGGLSQEAIKRVLDRAQSQLRYCYEKELQRVPDLNGKVTAKFTIGGTGSVVDASVATSTLQNASAEECMLRVFRRLRFPNPAGGGMVDVSYPMIYKPLGD